MMERGKLDREANEKKRDLLCWHSWCNSYILCYIHVFFERNNRFSNSVFINLSTSFFVRHWNWKDYNGHY